MHLANAHEIGGQGRGDESDTTWHVSTLVILHGSVFISFYYEYWPPMICIAFYLNIP
jgi:hypothetical protein